VIRAFASSTSWRKPFFSFISRLLIRRPRYSVASVARRSR